MEVLSSRLPLCLGFALAAVVFPASLKPNALKQAAGLIEDAVLRTRAVQNASRDASQNTVLLFWKKEDAGYNTVYSWLKAALEAYSGKWTLTKSAVAASAAPAAAFKVVSASSQEREEKSLEAAALEELAADASWEKQLAEDLATPRGFPEAALPAPVGLQSPASAALPDPLQSWLVLKALESRRSTVCPTATKQDAIVYGSCVLGEGASAQVLRGTQNGVAVAVKVLKENDANEFLHEVAVLSQLSHPNVVKILDVIVRPRMSIVLRYAGQDLSSALTLGNFSRADWRDALRQLLQGLSYIHDRFVVHGDVKPRNMCWQDRHLTILDFGCSVICLPGYRSYYPRSEVATFTHGLEYCTLPYRSVELLLGDTAWSMPSDCWSVGISLAAFWGVRPLFEGGTAKELTLNIFRQLGTPSPEALPYFRELPFYSSQMAELQAKSMADIMGEALPPDFAEILAGFLALWPKGRLTAVSALRVLCPPSAGQAVPSQASGVQEGTEERATTQVPSQASGVQEGTDERTTTQVPGVASLRLLSVGGLHTFRGERGPFNLREALLPHALLEWLRKGLNPTKNDYSWKVAPSQRDRWTEMDQKLEICGHLGAQPGRRANLELNGKDAAKPLPDRLRAFALAVKQVNRLNFDTLDSRIGAAIKALKKRKVKVGVNGEFLLKTPAADWAFDLGAIQLMRSNKRRDPVHFDGGASFLHMGLTLYGVRSLRCRRIVQDDSSGGVFEAQDEIDMPMGPGHVYLGCLCGPRHFVVHSPATELFHCSNLGPVEVVVLLRSRVFRAARGSTQQSGPVPVALWQALAPVMAATLAEFDWMLPSVAECEEQVARLTG